MVRIIQEFKKKGLLQLIGQVMKVALEATLKNDQRTEA